MRHGRSKKSLEADGFRGERRSLVTIAEGSDLHRRRERSTSLEGAISIADCGGRERSISRASAPYR